jgi:lysyl-tRNA synthetase class 1
MQWLDTLGDSVDASRAQLINDSKTPSGRVHVGALRGVLIHDAVYRALAARQVPVRYTFGVDDYDPLDELPAGLQDLYRPHLGQPLCNVPAPPGSDATDLADYFIGEFFGVFAELGVGAETYRMRDVYKSGRFNEPIEAILTNAATVRRIYRDVSHSERPEHWYPFQVLCQHCGRIGTTEVYDFDGREVKYRCRPDLVKWAQGCGHTGSVSPFDGHGKLPWKLEWVAKWHSFGITIEGAGKDHTTRGGSRDVAAACLKEIFGKAAPTNIPYEFFLVGGAKMSSSRGVGASAREIAHLLPPEVLRYLVLKSPPNRPVNFSPNEDHIVKLFNEFDRLLSAARRPDAPADVDRQLFTMCRVRPDDEVPDYEPPFQLLATLLQMPHLDVTQEIAKRKGTDLTAVEQRHLARRIESARYWLDHYASDEEKIRVQETLPRSALELSSDQKTFLHALSTALTAVTWEDDPLQTAIFSTAKLTPIPSGKAFEAIYRAFLDRASGPRAGSLLATLERSFVLKRLNELPPS